MPGPSISARVTVPPWAILMHALPLRLLPSFPAACPLIARHSEAVAEVPVEGDGAFLDIDTPQALEAARQG